MDPIQTAFLKAASAHGFTARKWNGTRQVGEVTQVISLQRSDYGPSYYLNVGLWPLVGDEQPSTVRAVDCPFRLRGDQLVPELAQAFDLEAPPGSERKEHASRDALDRVIATLDPLSTLESLRRLDREGKLTGWAVDRFGRSLLDGQSTAPGAPEHASLTPAELLGRITVVPPKK